MQDAPPCSLVIGLPGQWQSFSRKKEPCQRLLSGLTDLTAPGQHGCMKIPTGFRVMAAAALASLVTACATTPSGPAALAGTWTNALGTVWTINADGTFHVVGSAPRREIWGTFTIAGDTITIQETRRLTPIPKECKKPGVYKFSRPDSNTLAFVLVTDTCKPRVQNVTQTWHRK